jgi:pyrroline-5-carboxylate reductase
VVGLAEARQVLKDRSASSPMNRRAPFSGVLVVWATKPQTFREATQPVRAHVTGALHLSVAAGIPSSSIARWLGSERIVRSMPNTPALIGQGMTGLYARGGVTAQDRTLIESVTATMGESLWEARAARRRHRTRARVRPMCSISRKP